MVFRGIAIVLAVTVFLLCSKENCAGNVSERLYKESQKLKTHKCDKLCPPGRQCDIVGDAEACVCVSQCPARHKPVCGTDGHLYINHCDLHRTACVTGRKISIDWSDTCRQLSITKSKCSFEKIKSLKNTILIRFSRELIDRFTPERYIELLFHRQDTNEDKELDRTELATFVLSYAMYEDVRPLLGDCGMDDWINYEDTDLNGAISKDEFYRGYDARDFEEKPTEPQTQTTQTQTGESKEHVTTLQPELAVTMTTEGVGETPVIQRMKEEIPKPQAEMYEYAKTAHPTKNKNVFFAFGGAGIYVINPVTSSIVHHIPGSDVIKNTDSPICAHAQDIEHACGWGGAVNVGNEQVYAADVLNRRLIVVDVQSLQVVEAINVSGYPYDLQYVESRDEVWVLNWEERVTSYVTQYENDNGTINVVSRAKEKIKHTATDVPLRDSRSHAIHSLHVTDCCHLRDEQRYGYVTHVDEPGIHEIDLATKEYSRFINLGSFECHGTYGFTYSTTSDYGFAQCFTNADKSLRAQYPINMKTASVLSVLTVNTGLPHISPDGRYIVSLNDHVVSALFVNEENAIQIGEPIKTSMLLSDVAFLARDDGYDLYVTTKDTSALIVLHASPSGIETLKLISDLGLPRMAKDWDHVERSIVISCEDDARYLATPATAEDAIFILDGQRQVASGHVSGIKGVRALVWVSGDEE